jgi:hypothetical protein
MSGPPASAKKTPRAPRSGADAPEAREPGRPAERGAAARAHRLAHQRLGAEGEAVHRVGGDLEELEQHLVGGERHVPEPRAEEQEGDEDPLEEERPDQDVAVDRPHAAQAGGVEDPRPVLPVAAQDRVAAEPEPDREARPFGEEGGDRHPRHAPAEAEHEPEVEHDVHPVHHDLDHQHRAGAFGRDQPARDPVERDERGRGPDADGHVVARQRLDLGGCRGEEEGAREERDLQDDDGGRPRRR